MKNHIVVRISIACLCGLFIVDPAQARSEPDCLAPGQWAVPTGQSVLPAKPSDVLAQAGASRFVLLGEAHDDAQHHLWQLQALSMLAGARDKLVIGMEMFPRRVQPALDRWVLGEMTESEFLDASDWNRVWRFDPELYLPILRLARLNRIPLVALNVERSLISEVAAKGWNAIEPGKREGVTDPEPASEVYRAVLRGSFESHGKREDTDFEHFVEAQLLWDRAFAQALAEAATDHPDSLVVGIIGSGHLQHGHGVPHQLRALGKPDVAVWLPLGTGWDCDALISMADAVFAAGDSERAPPPRLGVYLVDGDGGAAIGEVVAGSVAEMAGLLAGDRIVIAAGRSIRDSSDIIAIVRRQPPGTWLPMTVKRDGKSVDIVARFPQSTIGNSGHGQPGKADSDE